MYLCMCVYIYIYIYTCNTCTILNISHALHILHKCSMIQCNTTYNMIHSTVICKYDRHCCCCYRDDCFIDHWCYTYPMIYHIYCLHYQHYQTCCYLMRRLVLPLLLLSSPLLLLIHNFVHETVVWDAPA